MEIYHIEEFNTEVNNGYNVTNYDNPKIEIFPKNP